MVQFTEMAKKRWATRDLWEVFILCDFCLDPGNKESDTKEHKALSLGRERNCGALLGDSDFGSLRWLGLSRGQLQLWQYSLRGMSECVYQQVVQLSGAISIDENPNSSLSLSNITKEGFWRFDVSVPENLKERRSYPYQILHKWLNYS